MGAVLVLAGRRSFIAQPQDGRDAAPGVLRDVEQFAMRWVVLPSVCRKPIRRTRSLRQKCRVDGKGQRRAIPPMILSHPNDDDNRSFSSSSASAAAWERLAGPESRPESR